MRKGLSIVSFILILCTQFIIPHTAEASVAYAEGLDGPITLTDLRDNVNYLFPNASYLSGLEYHSTWGEIERGSMTATSGIEVTYEAAYDQAPYIQDELPRINMYLLPFASQSAAETQFQSWSNSLNFTYGTWTKMTSGKDYFSYYTTSSSNNDLVKYRQLEDSNLHLVSYYDNIIMVGNFYREGGTYNKNNIKAYTEYMTNYEETLSVMNELFVYSEEALKFYLGSTFSIEGPDSYDYNPNNATYSLDLSDEIEIPLNGTLSFDVYIDDASEVGTILDMNGIDTPTDGMLSAGINENAVLEFNFYEADLDSGCVDESGWHHLYTSDSLDLYEWQTVTIEYGLTTGLNLWVDGEIQDSCAVYASRADTPVYLGDYPGDSINESFVGYVKGIETTYAVDDSGVYVDTLAGNMIFADVSEAYEYAEAIAYLKDEGIIEGYANGTFRPDQSINRVEILKMLFLGFGYDVDENYTMPDFSDLDEDAWYLPYLNYALDLEIVEGHDNGTYLPSHSLNRVEFLKILLRTYGINVNDYPITELYPDTDIDAWYASYVQYCKDYELMDPDVDGNFNPANEVTRGEVAETIYRLISQ